MSSGTEGNKRGPEKEETGQNIQNNSHSAQVHKSQPEATDLRSSMATVNQPTEVIEKVNEHVQQTHAAAEEDDDSMQHDGIDVSVCDSEDNFRESESEYKDEEEEPQIAQPNAHANEEDSDPDIMLSTKKRFLKSELKEDPQLKEVFDELVHGKVEETLEVRSKEGKSRRKTKT